MTLEGRVAEYLSQQKVWRFPNLMSILFHKRKMITTDVFIFSEGFNDINWNQISHWPVKPTLNNSARKFNIKLT